MRPLDGERGRTVTCNPKSIGDADGLHLTDPKGSALTTGMAETVATEELL
jgi:hypothetical protein